ncbi:MAG: hypothetical protein ACUVUU_09220 [bacterium]
MEKLLIISIDTYKKENIGKFFQGVPISPIIASIARQSISYDNYLASANWTILAYASIFTGKLTIKHL